MVKKIESKVMEQGSFWEGFNYSFGEMPNPKEVIQAVRELPAVMREIKDNRYNERREIIGSLTGAAADILIVYAAAPIAIGSMIYYFFK